MTISIEEIDKVFSAARHPIVASQAACSAVAVSRQPPAKSGWQAAKPSGNGLPPSPKPAAIAQVEQLKSATATFNRLPRNQTALPSLVVSIKSMADAIDRLLRDHYPLNPGQTRATLKQQYFSKRDAMSVDEVAKYHLTSWRELVQTELDFLQGLLQYNSPLGKEIARRAIEQRFQRHGGVLTVGLNRHQVHERLDPLHRSTRPFASAFADWLDGQISEGKDPTNGIVDFFLGYGSISSGGRCMAAERVRSLELKLDRQAGRVGAYYFQRGDGGFARYDNHTIYHEAQWFRCLTSVRRMDYNSEGGGGTGTATRGGDFVSGDSYVVDKKGRFYAFNGSTIHSEYLSGGDVQAAGIIVSVKGKIQAIDNRSGHYRPGWENLLQAVELLEGFFEPKAVVGLVVDFQSTMFFTVPDYIMLARAGFPLGPTTKVVRGYQTRTRGIIPVAPSMLRFIPPELREGWSNTKGNNWDQFFASFYDFKSKSALDPGQSPKKFA